MKADHLSGRAGALDERAADALNCARINAKPGCDLADAVPVLLPGL